MQRRRRSRIERWVAQLVILLVGVAFVASSLPLDVDCFIGDAAGGDQDKGPCSCPLACASCVVARTVPPEAERADLEPTPRLIAHRVPPVEATRGPVSPEPGEIVHVPKG